LAFFHLSWSPVTLERPLHFFVTSSSFFPGFFPGLGTNISTVFSSFLLLQQLYSKTTCLSGVQFNSVY
jgi:hypothetical protein